MYIFFTLATKEDIIKEEADIYAVKSKDKLQEVKKKYNDRQPIGANLITGFQEGRFLKAWKRTGKLPSEAEKVVLIDDQEMYARITLDCNIQKEALGNERNQYLITPKVTILVPIFDIHKEKSEKVA